MGSKRVLQDGYTLAFALSLGAHVLLITDFTLPFKLPHAPASGQDSTEMVYSASEQSALPDIQKRIAEMGRFAGPHASGSSAYKFGTIRVGGQAGGPVSRVLPRLESPGSVVDLANIAQSVGGDPVLLTYFSAIREQIQRTATQDQWRMQASRNAGFVYVSFILKADGSIADVAVQGDRSVPTPVLRSVAVQIVGQSAPFPAFPPSMPGEAQLLVIPLEFQ